MNSPASPSTPALGTARILTRISLALGLCLYLLQGTAIATQTAPHKDDKDYILVLNSADNTISLIDPDTYTEKERRPVGAGPHHLFPLPNEKYLVLGLTTDNQLVFITPNDGKIQKRIPMQDPYQMGFSNDNTYFVTTALRQNYVDIYPGHLILEPLSDKKIEVKRVKTAATPSHLAFSPDNRYVYVTEQDNDTVVQIDLQQHKIISRIKVGKSPAGLWVTPDKKHLLVGVMGEDYVAVIDISTGKMERKSNILTGAGAHNFLPQGDKRHLFVTNRVAGTISRIDMQTLQVKNSFKAPGTPDCMELSADGKTLWITARSRNKLLAINVASGQIEKEVKVGRSPHGIYYRQHAARE